jgi:hypothetical protein
MSKINNEVQKEQLALYLASGGTVADWAQANDVPESTAYHWSGSGAVRDRVEAIRRAVLAEAIKQLGDHAAAAARQIIKLATEASSEAVRLHAARAVLADFMTASNYASLAGRVAELEWRLRERAASPESPAELDPVGASPPEAGDDSPRGGEDDPCSPS